MTAAVKTCLALSEQDKRDVFSAAAVRLDTLPSYVEKDFWFCFVLDALYNRLPDRHPRLIFKGRTSLSKAFELILTSGLFCVRIGEACRHFSTG